MASAELGIVETRVPARLDRLPWSRFHWMVVISAALHEAVRNGKAKGLSRTRYGPEG